ncbi:adenine phosphoribosyltransferase, partial [Phakopsora pachyrhizi]
KKGIEFLDFFPILRDPNAFEVMINHLINHIRKLIKVDGTVDRSKDDDEGLPLLIVGLDSRGFLIGPTLASRLGCGFVPIRKPGKLPGKTQSVDYQKEYGIDTFEIQSDSIKPNQPVIIIDDLIATGGSARAAEELVLKLGATVLESIFVIEIESLRGTSSLKFPSYSIIKN